MEAYERQFYAALDQAWNEYVDDTMETVQLEAALHKEATEMMEAYERQFYAALDQAWNEYVDDTMETVQLEAALHREVVETTVNYLWDGSAYPGASLDDLYPRPSVSFAAKNQKSVQAAPQDNTK